MTLTKMEKKSVTLFKKQVSRQCGKTMRAHQELTIKLEMDDTVEIAPGKEWEKADLDAL